MLSLFTDPDEGSPHLPTTSLHLVACWRAQATLVHISPPPRWHPFFQLFLLLFFTTKLGMMSPLPLQMFFRASKTREHADMSLAALTTLEETI